MFKDHEFCSKTNLGHVRAVVCGRVIINYTMPPLRAIEKQEFRKRVIYSLGGRVIYLMSVK